MKLSRQGTVRAGRGKCRNAGLKVTGLEPREEHGSGFPYPPLASGTNGAMNGKAA